MDILQKESYNHFISITTSRESNTVIIKLVNVILFFYFIIMIITNDKIEVNNVK